MCIRDRAGTAPVSGSQSAPAPAPGSNTATDLDADEIAALINRGTDFLKKGDYISARLLLRRAADAGGANAALMLGATFDPFVIQEVGGIGIEPDVARARQWYETVSYTHLDVYKRQPQDRSRR